MQKMSKEEFLEILSRQELSGLTIKDFCANEAYTESSFYYWKGKFGLSRPYRSSGDLSTGDAFAPVNFTCPASPHLGSNGQAVNAGEIRIEFPGGIVASFSGIAESHAAMQLLTQICSRHVLPE